MRMVSNINDVLFEDDYVNWECPNNKCMNVYHENLEYYLMMKGGA